MSNLLRKLTSRGLSFSHLAKVSANAADDTPAPDDENKGKKGKKAADDGPDEQDRDNGDSENAEADPIDPDEDSDEGKGKKGKKAAEEDPDKDADAGDDDDEEMRGKSAVAQARRRERARCAEIMGSQHAGRNPVLAANLAFNSAMSRKEALSILKDTPTAASAAAPARRNPSLGGGGDATVTSGQAITSSWDHAMQKARPGAKKR